MRASLEEIFALASALTDKLLNVARDTCSMVPPPCSLSTNPFRLPRKVLKAWKEHELKRVILREALAAERAALPLSAAFVTHFPDLLNTTATDWKEKVHIQYDGERKHMRVITNRQRRVHASKAARKLSKLMLSDRKKVYRAIHGSAPVRGF